MTSAIAVEFKNVSKRYGSCIACRDITFRIHEGTIHGVIGENGAGKSTAMKILFGLDTPDTGSIELFGRTRGEWSSAIEAKTAGIGMVHQHFMLSETMTALDNLILAEGGHGLQGANRKKALARYQKLAEAYQFHIQFLKPVHDLSVGEQQRIEILKVLAQDSKIIILDEPTAVLTPGEVEKFFDQVRLLKVQGKTVIIITHKLKEIMSLTDEVTVLRQGAVIASTRTSATSTTELAEWMIGRKQVSSDLPAVSLGSDILSIRQLSFNYPEGTGLESIDLNVKAGEIVGVAGVEGNGQSALIDLFAHGPSRRRRVVGDARLFGDSLLQHNMDHWRARGAAFLPEDRLRVGVLEGRPAYENFLLGQQKKFKWLIPWTDVIEKTKAVFREYAVSPNNESLPIGQFSGGNQQKIVVGRELFYQPKFVLACHPTRGVDVGASEGIHQKLIQQARKNQAGVLIISSEIEELMKLCDRVVILYRGKLIRHFYRSEFNEQKIGAALGGVG